MKLYLVRHAEAVAKSIQSDRPLSEKGIEEVKRLAHFLTPLHLRVGAIWHSGRARAVQTAQLLASAVHADKGLVQREDMNPSDKIRPVVNDVETLNADLMIVGHLPFLSKIAGRLLTGSKSADVLVFQRGAVICLQDNRLGKWQIAWVLVPDLLTKTTG